MRIAWDQEQDRSKGFGHVEFVDEDAVDAAVKCAGKEVAGRMIRVDYAPGKKTETRTSKSKLNRVSAPLLFFGSVVPHLFLFFFCVFVPLSFSFQFASASRSAEMAVVVEAEEELVEAE